MEKISHQNKKPSFIKRSVPIIVVLAVVFMLLTIMKGMKQEPAKVPEKPKGFLVETAVVEPSNLSLKINSQGTLQAKRQITLTSEVSGKVMTLSPAFVAGGTFEAGEVLVKIDPADYQVAVARAQANLASAQAQLDLEQAKSDQAKKDWQSFGKTGTPSDLLLNIPQLDGAKAGLKAAKADLMKAQRDLEKTEIKAPFNGTVMSKSVDLGQFVGMAGGVGVIAGTDVAEVRLPLSNDALQKLNLMNRSLTKEPLTVSFFDESEMLVSDGLIKRIESSKDARTLMNYAVAEIEQPMTKGLLFNSFLLAEITGSTFESVFPIPTAWMMPNNQLAVYNDGGTLAIKTVEVIHKTNDYFYVNIGIDSQDHIITTPIQAPIEGMQLRLAGNDEKIKDSSAQEKTVKSTETGALP